MDIIYCDKEHSHIWDSFLENNENASFYQLFGWKEINEKSFGHETFYLAAAEGNEIHGILPMVYIRSRIFGRILCSMPFVNFGGLCCSNSDAENILLREAESIVNRNNIDYLEIRGINRVGGSMPTSEHKISMTLDLAPDPDLLWRAFATKHRTAIRRVYKKGLTVRAGGPELLDVFYDILSCSWKELGTPFYRKGYFKNIIDQFPRLIKIFIAFQGDAPVAAAFNGYYNGTVEGMWAGVKSRYRNLQPNYVLYWEMIRHACEQGFTKYHLGRSSVDSGGEFYKKKWNAYSSQLYWQYYLRDSEEMPQLNVKNPKYQLAINTWRKLPVTLTDIIGPLVAKNIP